MPKRAFHHFLLVFCHGCASYAPQPKTIPPPAQQKSSFNFQQISMGTLWNFKIIGPALSLASQQNMQEDIAQKLLQYDLCFSDWSEESELRRLEQNGLEKWSKSSALFEEGLSLAHAAYQQTQGYFDVTIGAVLWKERHRPIGMNHLEFSNRNGVRHFRFHTNPKRLSFGGLAKGMVLGDLANIILTYGDFLFMIDAGGGNLLVRNVQKTNLHFISQSSPLQNGRQHIFNPKNPKQALSKSARLVCQVETKQSAEILRYWGAFSDVYSKALIFNAQFELPQECRPINETEVAELTDFPMKP